MKIKRSKEEIELEKLIKAENKAKQKAEREHQKTIKEAEKAAKKAAKQQEPTEQELVHKYVNRVIKNQMYHGRVDSNKFDNLQHDKTVSKNLWLDYDFYFCVVFQSAEQKYQVLRHLAGENDTYSSDRIHIINGLNFAKSLGIELKEETTKDYPMGNIDLLPYVLDDEEI